MHIHATWHVSGEPFVCHEVDFAERQAMPINLTNPVTHSTVASAGRWERHPMPGGGDMVKRKTGRFPVGAVGAGDVQIAVEHRIRVAGRIEQCMENESREALGHGWIVERGCIVGGELAPRGPGAAWRLSAPASRS